jgi:hypothetical protein
MKHALGSSALLEGIQNIRDSLFHADGSLGWSEGNLRYRWVDGYCLDDIMKIGVAPNTVRPRIVAGIPQLEADSGGGSPARTIVFIAAMEQSSS